MAAMNQPGGPSTAVSVLQGYNFAATGKIANVTPVAIWPEATPFIRHMNTPESDSDNAEVVADLLLRGYDVVSAKDGRDLGLILREDLDLLGTAELLDSLTYRDHGPGTSGRDSKRWQSLANHLGLTARRLRVPALPGPVCARRHRPWQQLPIRDSRVPARLVGRTVQARPRTRYDRPAIRSVEPCGSPAEGGRSTLLPGRSPLWAWPARRQRPTGEAWPPSQDNGAGDYRHRCPP